MLQLKGGEPNHSFVLKCCNDTHYHSTAPCYNCGATLGCLRHSAATPVLGTAASKLYQSLHPAMNLLCALARSLFQITDSPKLYATKLSWVAGARRLSLPA